MATLLKKTAIASAFTVFFYGERVK
ncbi:protein of unknown function [Paraburkholderia dioscoreae]|uniref:Uncharacterized protein n=1 Tax=Paraburkholderia dioscoreae TaxID=2604047 RepID=A0A5Q4ZCH4_9BURK|nr:protein of unknown function [Paraburkholderia dioscoreae]